MTCSRKRAKWTNNLMLPDPGPIDCKPPGHAGILQHPVHCIHTVRSCLVLAFNYHRTGGEDCVSIVSFFSFGCRQISGNLDTSI